jgi:hypothetical protein
MGDCDNCDIANKSEAIFWAGFLSGLFVANGIWILAKVMVG